VSQQAPGYLILHPGAINQTTAGPHNMAISVASDIGGTFTDVVTFDARANRVTFRKELTDYADPIEGIARGMSAAGADEAVIEILKHGTTFVVNMLLQRNGARVALVTTEGFSDILEIGRAGRPVAFRFDFRRDPPLVERPHRLEVAERIDARGDVIRFLEQAEIDRIVSKLKAMEIDAVAVALLNAYRNDVHERALAAAIRKALPGCFVTAGTEITREWFEFERMSTAVANSYVGPAASGYVRRLGDYLERHSGPRTLQIMASNGGVMSPEKASAQPINLLESGPVSGCIGVAEFARRLGIEKVVAFDMGGTTAKCALVEKGDFAVEPLYYVGGYIHGFPIRAPILDIVEVGTGGGSIARCDEVGHLKVGPRSAGSTPGPACFGRGGTEPTVTDANLLLGYLGGKRFLDGALSLDRKSAAEAMLRHVGAPLGYDENRLDEVASGVVALANTHMSNAIREITVERGHDIREFTLFAFGGGGPIHAAVLARELHMRKVIIPPEPGNFSALGMLFANPRLDYGLTIVTDLDGVDKTVLDVEVGALRRRIRAELVDSFPAGDVVFKMVAQLQHKGQRHAIEVEMDEGWSEAWLRARFLDLYERRYGLSSPHLPIEIIGFRVSGTVEGSKPRIYEEQPDAPTEESGGPERRRCYFRGHGWLDTAIHDRAKLPQGRCLTGPAIIEEYGSTVVLGPGDRLLVGPHGVLEIEIAEQEKERGQ
jgi:N-methylhydantoinase A